MADLTSLAQAVKLVDLPAVCERYGVQLVTRSTTGAQLGFDQVYLDAAPEQTPEQRAAWAEHVKHGDAKPAPQAVTVKRYPLSEMVEISETIRAVLEPTCERLIVVGSVRRKKETCHDCEIVSQQRGTELYKLTDSLLAQGIIAHRLDKNGRKSYGQKYRRLLWDGVPFDLFVVPPAEYGATVVIRTGSADFSHAMVIPRGAYGICRETGERVPGLLANDVEFVGNRLRRWHHTNGYELLDTDTESKFFAAAGVPYVQPHERTLETVRRLATQ